MDFDPENVMSVSILLRICLSWLSIHFSQVSPSSASVRVIQSRIIWHGVLSSAREQATMTAPTSVSTIFSTNAPTMASVLSLSFDSGSRVFVTECEPFCALQTYFEGVQRVDIKTVVSETSLFPQRLSSTPSHSGLSAARHVPRILSPREHARAWQELWNASHCHAGCASRG